jgi:uncharacterized protein (TIGR01319 family)
MGRFLLVDFGSTCTKLTAADAAECRVLGTARAFTTVDTDIAEGFEKAFSDLNGAIGPQRYDRTLACSSAAGGLKVVAVGLVPELTAEAARRAALSAGAKVSRAFSYELSAKEIKEVEDLRPDIVLLTGGTDGGNKAVLLHNARAVAGMSGGFPVVVAGNKCAADEAADILKAAGREFTVCENVMPAFNELNILPARERIRDVFMKRIIRAKGLTEVEKLIGGIMMPTPLAVLTALEALASGAGVGELVAADVGGATTDVYSIGMGLSASPGVVFKGLPEPFAKRTVEGDIGVRYTAKSLMELVGLPALARASGLSEEETQRLVGRVDADHTLLPKDEPNVAHLDHGLGTMAVRIAVQRHAGHFEAAYMPFGRVLMQSGKDLRDFRTFIGTGGPVLADEDPAGMLGAALKGVDEGLVLVPRNPEIHIDGLYIIAAMGLLCQKNPPAAARILKRELGF